MNIFDSPQVTNAFARSERILGNQPFELDDGRKLKGTINRVRRGETTLDNGIRILADAVVAATRPQFTPKGGEETLPVALETIISFVCRTSNPMAPT